MNENDNESTDSIHCDNSSLAASSDLDLYGAGVESSSFLNHDMMGGN